ncbi:ADP-ribosylation factor-like protein 5A [Tritrichomonas foetus]|uniref:ADP-ribosylation factor-like protein 5A n=1 Tax=Tritrichomonas foetus TaxID=1144522 RepID=A0A1J4KRU1_9EUKA|nr:ADP-ribosylation factor-like protein 5A [Tritrichomonas foetus]|eukprot:OHT13991.1 ADP-ribosylation factor-like protein 5A [Tritrichomonas foetus]
MESPEIDSPEMDPAFQQLLIDMMSGKTEEEDIPEVSDGYSLVLMMGLDDSGKTSLLNQFIHHEFFKPSPTNLAEHTKFTFNDRNLFIREIGGRYRYREDWPTLYEHAKALIWVIDLIDRGRVIESREEFEKVINHELIKDLPVLIILNKIDSRLKMERNVCCELMQFSKYENKNLKIIETCQRTCQEIDEGFKWIIENLPEQPKNEAAQE